MPARIAAIAALTAVSLLTLSVLGFLVLTRKHTISSGSMEPSLKIDEFAMFLPIAIWGDPKIGDIVTFRHADSVWVKRLVAGPGDRVSMSKGVLRLNGRNVTLRSIGPVAISAPLKVEQPGFEETLPNGRSHLIFDADPQGSFDNMAEITVPDGKYFVLGDNRDNSYDSRSPKVGLVGQHELLAKSPLIYFSYNRNGIRMDRIGTWVR